MITLLVSSKSMVPKEVPYPLTPTQPWFEPESEQIHNTVEKLNEAKLRELMHVSDSLAKEVRIKITGWESEKTYPAWLLFSGDVYKGLVAETLDKEDFEWAQDRVWTLSGLYGIARPLDGIKPYRLEAGYRLSVGGRKNLYDFWGDKIAKKIIDDTVINLSSEEYIKLIRKEFPGKIITPLFLQDRKSGVKFEAVHAKVARGSMARWIIKNRIKDPNLITNFASDDYYYDKGRSSELEPVFVRKSEGVMKIKKP